MHNNYGKTCQYPQIVKIVRPASGFRLLIIIVLSFILSTLFLLKCVLKFPCLFSGTEDFSTIKQTNYISHNILLEYWDMIQNSRDYERNYEHYHGYHRYRNYRAERKRVKSCIFPHQCKYQRMNQICTETVL